MSNTPGKQYTNRPVPDMNADLFVCTGIETAIGDGLWFDNNGAFSPLIGGAAQTKVPKPFSQILDQGNAVATQTIAAQWFLGISAYNQKANDTSPNPALHQARIWTRQEWRDYPCVAQTWEIGDLVAPAYTAVGANLPGALSDQLLTKTTNPACAIGRVTKRSTVAVNTVAFVMMSRLLEDFTNDGTVPSLSGFTLIGPEAAPVSPNIFVPVTGGTIPVPVGSQVLMLNPGGNVTGAIMAPGTQDGQTLTLINITSNTVTFAAVGGNIADGVLAAVPSQRQFQLTWVASQNAWFHT